MPNASGSVTLADYALYSNSPLIQKVSYSLLENGSVLQDVPLKVYRSLVAIGSRFIGGLPAVGWRAINDIPALVKADPTAYQEQAYIMSNQFGVDKMLLDDQNSFVDPFALNLGAWLKSRAFDFNDKFINNNHVTGDSNAVVGLRARLDNAAQFGIPTEMKFAAGGSSIDISAGSNGDGLIESIQQALDIMGSSNGTDVVMYMNELTRRKVDRAVKKLGTSGGFETTKDQFGRRVMMFNDAKVVTIGRKADTSTQIITSTETSAGVDGSSNYSSIYFVRYGEEYMSGWEVKPLDEAVIGPILDTVSMTQMKVVIDWAVGLWQANNRSVARVYGIKTS